MNALLALSLSNSVTDVGAIAAFAALFGIAVLSLLVFSQAREIKRLREWAGRAPERAAETEQRVSADAAARLRGEGAPPAPAGAARGPSGARVVPRKTPLVSAPVSTAVNATVAAVVPGSAGSPPPGSVPVASAGEIAPAAAAASGGQGAAAEPSGDQGSKSIADFPAPTSQPMVPAADAVADRQAQPLDQTAQSPAGPAQPAVQSANPAPAFEQSARSAGDTSRPLAGRSPHSAAQPDAREHSPRTAPATAAARAAGASARAPLPPSPAAPAPPGAAPSSVALPPADSPAASSKPVSRPPAPVAAARSVPSRAVDDLPVAAPPRSPAQIRARANVPATSAGARTGARAPGGPQGSGPKYFKPERSPRRAIALIVGGVIVGVLVLVLAVSVLKGGGSTPTATSSSSSEASVTGSHKASSAAASKPSETAVVVLNGTGTPNLAHHLAADLQQGGYTLAAASAGVPPGTHATTVVQYTHGHRADAKAVAKALNVTQVQAIESTIASLVGSATVVVLAGADQASQLGGGGAQSNGEPAAGTAGSG